MTRRGRGGVTADVLRDLALALPGVTEVPHMERRAFRTTRRMFATVAADEASANLLFDPVLQAAWIEEAPAAFAPVSGGWGRMGYTTLVLPKLDAALVKRILADSHALAAPKAKPKKA